MNVFMNKIEEQSVYKKKGERDRERYCVNELTNKLARSQIT